MHKLIERKIQGALGPLRKRITQCESTFVIHGKRLDNLTSKTEATYKVQGSSDFCLH